MSKELGLKEAIEPIDYLALAVDTSNFTIANRLIDDFAEAGGSFIKLGLKAASAFGGPEGLSVIAQEHGLRWIYDGKIIDIETTMVDTIREIADYSHPPVAITIHAADMSFGAMQGVQEVAGDILILGVAYLSDIAPEEAYQDHATYGERKLVEEHGFSVIKVGEGIRVRKVMERARKLGQAGVRGLVASPKELVALNEDEITKSKFKMTPGTRSIHAEINDQKNVMTPEYAIANGADLLVVGRQYTAAEHKPRELLLIQDDVARGLERRMAQQSLFEHLE